MISVGNFCPARPESTLFGGHEAVIELAATNPGWGAMIGMTFEDRDPRTFVSINVCRHCGALFATVREEV